ncbi:PKD domain-containing protein [Draconibacterium mangrovi]|uniref:PKD domain-containing protein n=1 Tax=Draconibacterium mangrovi TaxID=2697469 RepID=UPI0013D7C008|nr:PKD domain-containing protein [Draconibacterium mangrovi]
MKLLVKYTGLVFYALTVALSAVANDTDEGLIEGQLINRVNSQAEELKVDFSFPEEAACSGTTIQFTSEVTGKPPYKYSWDFGDGTNSDKQHPTHVYNSQGCGIEVYTVVLTVTDGDTISNAINKQIEVKQKPDINFADPEDEFGNNPFNNCSFASIENPSYTITVENTSPSANCISNYDIDWGDGNFETSISFPITHTYDFLGAYKMVISAIGDNGCKNDTMFVVKNQTNPSGGINSPGETAGLCSPTDELQFTISQWGNNAPGTRYEIDYGDGSEIKTFFQDEMMNSEYYDADEPSASRNFPIPHSYTISNCPNEPFVINMDIINECLTTPASVGGITVYSVPQADFTVPSACVNTSVSFTNTTIPGFDSQCRQKSNFTWDFGDGSDVIKLVNVDPQSVSHTYTAPGEYSVTLTAKNSSCGETSITKQITVSELPTATISGDNSVCVDDELPLITFVGANGTPPYSFNYRINNGSIRTVSTADDKNSVTVEVPTNQAGTYIYSLESVKSQTCSQTQSGTAEVVVNPAPKATIAGDQNVCLGSDEPRITFTGIDGTPPYTFTYTINGGDEQQVTTITGDTVTVSAPTNAVGTYHYNLIDVQETSVNACAQVQSGTATITVNQPPSSLDLTDYEYCNGVATSKISFSDTVPNTTFTWVNSNTAIGLSQTNGMGDIPSFIARNTGDSAITSIITVTPESMACVGESQSFKITVNPSATVQFSPDNQMICSGGNSEEVKLSSTTTGAVFSWTATEPAGISGVTTSGSDIIPVQNLINTTDTPIDVIYTAQATVSGMTSCEGAEYKYIITVYPEPVITEVYEESICNNSAFTIIPENNSENVVPSGTQYIWDLPVISPADALVGADEQNVPQNRISQILENKTTLVATATYTVTPLLDNCAGTPFEVVVSVSPTPTIDSISNIILCESDLSDEIVFTGVIPGTYFEWETNNSGIGISLSGTDSIPPFTAVNNGTSPVKATITVVPTLNIGTGECKGEPYQFTITVNPSAQVNNPGDIDVCIGDSVKIEFTTNNLGGTTSYTWTNSNRRIGLEGTGTGDISFAPVNSGSTVTTATIEVTPNYSSNGVSCTGEAEQFIIRINPELSMDQPSDQILCNGAPTDSVFFNGNLPDMKFYWTNDNPLVGLGSSGEGTIPTFVTQNNTADTLVSTITVTPSLNNCNGETKTFLIKVIPAGILTQQPISNTICLEETLTELSVDYKNGTGTPVYQWYKSTSNSTYGGVEIPNATAPTYLPPNTSAGTSYYYCVISFPSGDCSTLTSNVAEIIINPYPVISTYTIDISSGKTFSVEPDSLNGDIVPEGTTYTWEEPEILPLGSVTGASAEIIPQALISQTLTNNSTSTSTVIYKVTPTSGSCVGEVFNVVVNESPPMNTNAVVNHIPCYGANNGSIETKIEGGSPISSENPYLMQWTGPDGYTSSMESIYNLKPGIYDLEVTDAIGTKYNFSYTITEPEDIVVTLDTEKNISCNGAEDGEITLTVTGGTGEYTYEWKKDDLFFSDKQDITNLAPGEYSVSVTDENDCGPKMLTFEITQPDILDINILSITNIECYGDNTGAISIDVQGGTMKEMAPGVFDYQYLWSGDNGFSSTEQNISDLVIGNYTLWVVDAFGCTDSQAVQIEEPNEIEVFVEQTSISCYGASDASISLTVSGGVSPYDIGWSNFATGAFQDNLSPGDYIITITDANGCLKVITETIAEPDVFTINPVVKNVSCNGLNDGSINLNFIGGQPPINFSWLDNETAGATRNNLPPGIYTVNISDNAGCSINESFIILEPSPLQLKADIKNSLDCIEDNSGAIDLHVAGGQTPFNYLWSNEATTEDLLNIQAGDYFVTVTDMMGCSEIAQFSVDRPLPLELEVDTKINYDCESQEVTEICTADVRGGMPPYQYNWSVGTVNDLNPSVMETELSGMVVLTVTDSVGCSIINSFETYIPQIGLTNKLINCNDHAYQFEALVASEDSKYTFEWNFDDGNTSSLKNPMYSFNTAGAFNVQLSVTNDITGCVSTFNQVINVEPIPTISLSEAPQFCEGDSILVFANGTDYFEWSDGTFGDSILITDIGNYSVIGTSINGCKDSLSFEATNFEDIGYAISADKEEVTPDQNVVYFSTENIQYSDYTWDFGDEIEGYASDISHSYDITSDGFYSVLLNVINPYGCLEQDSIRIIRNIVDIPNTFTPNGDGINDFYLSGWNIKIYNRNGILMFEGDEGWDGTYNGKPADNDTYFVIVYDSSAEGSKYRTNYVTVLR